MEPKFISVRQKIDETTDNINRMNKRKLARKILAKDIKLEQEMREK